MSSRFHSMLLMLGALLLSGCTMKIVYNNLDTFLVEYVEGIVTLDEQLGERVSDRASELLRWHRETQLIEYAALLRQLRADYAIDVSQQTLTQHADTIEDLWKQLATRLDSDMAELLPQLDAEQRTELFATLDSKNARFQREYVDVSDEERLERYIDNLTDSYQDWLGDLSAQQESMIEATASQLRITAPGQMLARVAWQNGIRDIITDEAAAASKTARLTAFFANFDRNDYGDVAAAFEHNRNKVIELTQQILSVSDLSQREHFFEESADYIQMFEELNRDE